MMVCMMILAGLLFQQQDDLPARTRPLIEKLRSEKIEDREEAIRELRKLGRDVLPMLRKLAQDPELEFAGRVQAAIRSIDLREKLKAEARETGAVDAATVVDWMTVESGRRILCGEDMGLRNKRIRVSPEALEAGDAYEAGLDLLKTVDIAAIPEENDSKRLTLVYAPIAAKKGLKVYTSVESLPKANEFCTLVVSLRHVSPREVQAALINLISFPQNCLSVESAGKVILSDFSSSLRKQGRLIDQLDVSRSVQACRVSVALLVATADGTPSVPEAFRGLRLAETTGRNRFVLAGEGFGRLENPPPAPGVRGTPGIGLSVRLTGDRPYVVEMDGAAPQPGGVQVERLAIRSDAEADRKASPLLQARLFLKKGDWTVAGAVPGEKEGTIVIVALRADPE